VVRRQVVRLAAGICTRPLRRTVFQKLNSRPSKYFIRRAMRCDEKKLHNSGIVDAAGVVGADSLAKFLGGRVSRRVPAASISNGILFRLTYVMLQESYCRPSDILRAWARKPSSTPSSSSPIQRTRTKFAAMAREGKRRANGKKTNVGRRSTANIPASVRAAPRPVALDFIITPKLDKYREGRYRPSFVAELNASPATPCARAPFPPCSDRASDPRSSQLFKPLVS